jgi:glycyl-tRNA synthetase beta chain
MVDLRLATAPEEQALAAAVDRARRELEERVEREDFAGAMTALAAFLKTDDGANLLAGYKRAVNILKAEEKKGPLPTGEPTAMAEAPAEETALIAAVGALEAKLADLIEREDFAAAMSELAKLRGPVDAFFDKVLVNSTVSEERDNRLRLLAKVRDATGRVADFSQVTG